MTVTGEPQHRVVLDANIFFHPPVRDFFLTGAREVRLIEVRWSQQILAEVERNWARVTGADRAADRWQRLSTALQRAFPDAIAPTVALPPAGYSGVASEDWHVVSTSLTARANGIVTLNRRHFPVRTLSALGLHIWSPDELCMDLYRRAGDRVLLTLTRQSMYLRRARSLTDTLMALAQQCPRFVTQVRADLDLT